MSQPICFSTARRSSLFAPDVPGQPGPLLANGACVVPQVLMDYLHQAVEHMDPQRDRVDLGPDLGLVFC